MPLAVLVAAAALPPAVLAAGNSAGAGHAVVLIYHHVSTETPAATSIPPQLFSEHLEFLDARGFRVLPLRRLLTALKAGEPLPDNAVAITFDDAYESVYTEARPRLAEYGWPFTVFVNTDAIDAGREPYMSWDQLLGLAADGAAIENHSASHAHLARRPDGETVAAWRERVRADVGHAHARIAEEIGTEPALFAWPYGEYAPALTDVVSGFYSFALAQRSGAIGRGDNWHSDWFALPRFPFGGSFDSVDRLAMAVNARPLPVVRASSLPPMTDGAAGQPRRLELELAPDGYRADSLSCFAASGARLETGSGGDGNRRVRVELSGAGGPGRNKINCTAAAADGSGDYYWYSFQWLQRGPGGGWPAH
ncbi:MAG: polysaccharide deacetylase family protein [Wenzhouxiangellaceae bacterium]|nr:polysaccharide deacetylase family protein [Wenzhouxiangellaceae bacterium]